MARVMALDVGDSRVGIAISDPLGITANPRETVPRAKAYKRIAELVSAEEITKIVIGLPLESDGTEGPQAQKVQKFSRKLNAQLEEVPLEFLDERFTTKQAEGVLIGSGLKNAERSAALDRISAALILEQYLTSKF